MLSIINAIINYEYKMSLLKSALAVAISTAIFSPLAFANTDTTTNDIEVITVSGDFRSASLQNNTSSLSVVTAEEIDARNAQNLEEILAISPNVNFSSGSQRARYFQIRGIGERSQFQAPINPSVGVMLDGVDFTGIASVASMFDVEQVEIFSGPQGTRFGANALAGFINVTTKAPSETFEGALRATLGNYGAKGLGLVLSGPAGDAVNYRIAAESYESDGFIDNIFLNRDDTNNRDEKSIRAKFAIQATDDLAIDIALMHFDFDNGYDAFSLDRNRTTYSNEPGFDTQETTALATTFTFDGFESAQVKLLTSYADSDLGYGYDEDWAFGDYDWETGECLTQSGCLADAWGYASTDHYFRERQNATADLRFVSNKGAEIFNGTTSWVAGVYYKNEDSDLTRSYTFDSDFNSTFKTDNYALYGQLDTALTDKLTLTTGLRYEERKADYVNSDGLIENPSDYMLGGKVVLSLQATEDTLFFASANRGYKAGGINTSGSVTPSLRAFDPEFLINYEVGTKTHFFDNSVYLRATAFYMDRNDMQVNISYQETAGSEFITYIDNAAGGKNTGVELQSGWYINDVFDVHASLGLLDTQYTDFVYINDDGVNDLSGRSQGHAPNYQYHLALNTQLSDDLLFNVSVEGKDSFYYNDNVDSPKTKSYALLNASLRYEMNDWDVTLWARNITDNKVETRGFNFPNDPRDGYTSVGYTQLGEPAVYGVTINAKF